MGIGNQYKLDDGFKAAARLHQSKYRDEVLQVGFEDYGNRLTDEHAQALLNYYDKLNCTRALRSRYPFYSKTRDADMLRSEHIPFNFFAPFDTHRHMAMGIIRRAFGIDCTAIDFVAIEYAPEPKENYLNDATSFDTYLQVRLPNEKKCGIGIEVKYTEQDYRIGKSEAARVKDHNSLYWQTARKSDCFTDPDNEIFGSDPMRQVWRNHLLGLSMLQHDDIDEFYSITLFPDGNKHFHEVLPRYTAMLKEDAKCFVFGCTFERFISSIGGTSEFDEWKAWLERRYLVK